MKHLLSTYCVLATFIKVTSSNLHNKSIRWYCPILQLRKEASEERTSKDFRAESHHIRVKQTYRCVLREVELEFGLKNKEDSGKHKGGRERRAFKAGVQRETKAQTEEAQSGWQD